MEPLWGSLLLKNDMCFMNTNGTSPEICLQLPGTFFSVAMSFDATRFAMVLRDQGGRPLNSIAFFDLPANTTRNIPLQAPLIDGATINVLQADGLDFSANGEELIYDALNQIVFPDGTQIGLWSIYALNLASNTVTIIKSPVPNFDFANPSLSQTSDQYLAFEVIDQSGASQVVLLDRFSGNQFIGPQIQGAAPFVIPAYTGDDSAIIFGAPSQTFTGFSLFRQPLAGDHLTFNGNPSLWLPEGGFGVIYRRGSFSGKPSL